MPAQAVLTRLLGHEAVHRRRQDKTEYRKDGGQDPNERPADGHINGEQDESVQRANDRCLAGEFHPSDPATTAGTAAHCADDRPAMTHEFGGADQNGQATEHDGGQQNGAEQHQLYAFGHVQKHFDQTTHGRPAACGSGGGVAVVVVRVTVAVTVGVHLSAPVHRWQTTGDVHRLVVWPTPDLPARVSGAQQRILQRALSCDRHNFRTRADNDRYL